jgi:hypothetical protein
MFTQTQSKKSQNFFKAQKPASVLKPVLGGGYMADIEKVSGFQIELTSYNVEVENALAHARKVAILSNDDATSNLEFAGEMRKLAKKIDASKKEITAPAREFIAKMNNLSSGYVEKLNEAIDIISSKIGSYNSEQIERQRNELEALAIIEEAAGIKTDYSVIPIKENVKTALASTYQTIEYEIDIEDFSKIPTEYLMLNEALVKQAIKSGRDEIPGLRITEKKVTRIRTK